MSELAEKCGNNAICKQNCTLTVLIALKWTILAVST